MRPNPSKQIGSNRYFLRHTSFRTLITAGCALLLAGCTADRPAANQAAVASSPMSTTSSTSPKLPPLPDQAEMMTRPTSKPAPTTTASATRPRADGQCGTVTAASGFALRVMPGDAATGCRLAERVIAAFHAEIAGQQPAGSRHPVKATVGGWNCVSGPPSSQGGTSCSKGDTDVLAAVITDE